MSGVTLTITRNARGWAIRHNDGVLGYAKTQAEAGRIAKDLLLWLVEHGRGGVIRSTDLPGTAGRH